MAVLLQSEKIFFVSREIIGGDYVDDGGYVVSGFHRNSEKGETEKTFALC